MKIKEILPWSIESPVIHLVQPSPTIPLGHEVVFQQSSTNGNGVSAIYALAAQEKKARRQKRIRQDKQREFKEKKESNLSCGFISPPIHQANEDQKKRKSSYYDLRINRSMSISVENTKIRMTPPLSSRSKSLDEHQPEEPRKRSPDFEDILRELGCASRLSSDAAESITSKTSENSESESRSDIPHRHEFRRQSSSFTVISNDSVFYDISLDDPEVERASPQVEIAPRKSFSEETFDKNRPTLLQQRNCLLSKTRSKWSTLSSDSCDEAYEEMWSKLRPHDKRPVSQMVDDLLLEIYGDKSSRPVRRRSCTGILRRERLPNSEDSVYEDNAYYTEYTSGSETFRLSYLQTKRVEELREMVETLHGDVKRLGGRLVKQLIRRDCLAAKRDWHCDWVTAYLQAHSEKRSEDTKTRFSVAPSHGDSGFTQWQNGMRMVARLPEGIPPQFRKTLWLNLAEKHLVSRGVQWREVEEFCFNEFTNPDDEELGVQIVKDVHRTGCSLFCGVSGKDNQALLKRVLLAYARWNKAVGYCQGFNMLAALILQVMDKSEVDSVKVMIYLIEGVLPESYFANNLRGLSVDMAVFRDLLRIKLPTLSRHFDQLQNDSKDSGTSYEPPLTNVFTMQWFLTLFCNCLPQDTVLRVWDLIFLEGNHILLCTALAIWSTLSDRIMTVESADEFYCIMGVLTREMLEFGLMDANALIKAIVSFNLPELPELREKYLYNITPWTQSVSTVARRGLRLFYSDDDTDTEEDDEKIAIATAYGLFRSPKKKEGASGVTSPPRTLICPDKEKIAMDISALTKQYRKLRERQKQAHVILTAACGSQSLVGPTTSPAMNHLLMGKFALVNSKGRRLGPPAGSIPPPSQSKPQTNIQLSNLTISGETLHWKDAMDTRRTSQRGSDDEKSPDSPPSKYSSRRGSSSSSTSTELCDDPQRMSDSEDQTNSLSECYSVQDKTGPTTPKRVVHSSVQHPLDTNLYKEKAEENSISPDVEQPPRSTELDIKLRDETALLSVEEEDEALETQQKRKPSFRIDPEEMRQLDRKLSLKIVEIERRKSNAGIESEDLNSKVLFPFDRDYIQELEKTDRDTPTSIPDDRMCCSDEFICDFEEETILVPDITTNHKTLGFRMTSLEECDETKIDNEDSHKESIDVNKTESSQCSNLKSPEENFDQEEIQNGLVYSDFNFDELFKKRIIENERFEEQPFSSSENITECILNNISEPEQNKALVNLGSDITPSVKDIVSPTNVSVDTGNSHEVKCTNHESGEITGSSNYLNKHIQNLLQTSAGSKLVQSNTLLSDDMKVEFSISEIMTCDDGGLNLEACSKPSNSTTNEKLVISRSYVDTQNFDESTSFNLTGNLLTNYQETENKSTTFHETQKPVLNLSDHEKVLELKLATLLPKVAVQIGSEAEMPDVTSISSRDLEINSIREKYAHYGETSIGISKMETDHGNFSKRLELSEMPVSKNPNCDINSQTGLFSSSVNKDFGSFSKTQVIDFSSTNDKEENCLPEQSKTLNTKIFNTGTNGEEELLNSEVKIEKISSETIIGVMSDVNSDVHADKKIITENITNIVMEESTKSSPTVQSIRRGSEVALNLILKENLQILSKIQQQSRRSSEINVDSKQSCGGVKKIESDKQPNLQNVTDANDLNNISKNTKSKFTEAPQLHKIQPNNTTGNLTETSAITLWPSDDTVPEELNKPNSPKLFKNHFDNEISMLHENPTDEILLLKNNLESTESFINSSKFYKDHESTQDEKVLDTKMNDDSKDLFQTPKLFSSSDSYSLDESSCDPINLEQKQELITDEEMCRVKAKTGSFITSVQETDEDSVVNIKPIQKKLHYSFVDDDHFVLLSGTRNKLDDFPIQCSSSSEIALPSDKSSSDSNTYNLSPSNDDILKELRFLDINPEETLDYTECKNKPFHPSPEEPSLYSKTAVMKKSCCNSLKLEDNLPKTKESAIRYSAGDTESGESKFRNTYKVYKTDYLNGAKDRSKSYVEERHRPLVRSSTTADDDDSLYMNSYKNHGRLLIEKGELNTYRSFDEEAIKRSEFHFKDGQSSTPVFSESACGLKTDGNILTKKFTSTYLSEDSSLFEKTKSREKTLFKYNSEDYGGSNNSSTHYRFSSASPIRKRLDPLSTIDTPLSKCSNIDRTKSPSPTGYSSSKPLPVKEDNTCSKYCSSSSRPDATPGISRNYKKYSRTESLDLNTTTERTIVYQKKRAESFEISLSDKGKEDTFLKEKKPLTSPVKFNPFPVRSSPRQPKELGVKLGLYLPPKSDKSPSKRLT